MLTDDGVYRPTRVGTVPGVSDVPVPQADGADREKTSVERIKDALREDAAETHSPEQIERAVDDAVKHYDDAPVRDFVPVLAERDAREALRDGEHGQ
jgi:Protein of unknown function (DUF3562)